MPKVESQTETAGVNGYSNGVHPGQLKPPWVLRGFKTLILGHNGHSRAIPFNGINAGRPPEVRIVPQIQIEGVENQEPGEAVRLIAGIADEIAHLYDGHHVVSVDELDERIANNRALKNTHKALAVESLQEWLLTHDEDLRRTKTGRVRKEETDRQKALIVRKAATKARKILNGVAKSSKDHLGLDHTTAVVISEYRKVSVATNREIRRQNRAKKELTQLMLLGNYLTNQNRIEHDIHLLNDAKQQVIDEISRPVLTARRELHYYQLEQAHPTSQALENIKKEVQRIETAARAQVRRGADFDPDFANELHPLKQAIAGLEVALARKESLVPDIVKSPRRIPAKGRTNQLKSQALDYLQRNRVEFTQPVDHRSMASIAWDTETNILGLDSRYTPEDLERIIAALHQAAVGKTISIKDVIEQTASSVSGAIQDETVLRAGIALIAAASVYYMLDRSLGELRAQNNMVATREANISTAKATADAGLSVTPTPRPTFTPEPASTPTNIVLRAGGLLADPPAATEIVSRMTATAKVFASDIPTPTIEWSKTPAPAWTPRFADTATPSPTPTPTNSPEPTRTSTNTPTPTATREPSPTHIPTKVPDSPTPSPTRPAPIATADMNRDVQIVKSRGAAQVNIDDEIPSWRIRDPRYQPRDCPQWVNVINQHWGRFGKKVVGIVRVLMARESSCDPQAFNNKTNDHGLMQINAVHEGSFIRMNGDWMILRYSPDHNIRFGATLYEGRIRRGQRGFQDWVPCWDGSMDCY